MNLNPALAGEGVRTITLVSELPDFDQLYGGGDPTSTPPMAARLWAVAEIIYDELPPRPSCRSHPRSS